MKIVVNCISELSQTSQMLLDSLDNSNIVYLYGEMGVGKTTFVKEICKCLEVEDVVSSPTFSIVNQYLCKDKRIIFHFDFYRIKSVEEIFDMGFEEYFYKNHLCIVEWPEMIEPIIDTKVVKVRMQENNKQRIIEILKS